MQNYGFTWTWLPFSVSCYISASVWIMQCRIGKQRRNGNSLDCADLREGKLSHHKVQRFFLFDFVSGFGARCFCTSLRLSVELWAARWRLNPQIVVVAEVWVSVSVGGALLFVLPWWLRRSCQQDLLIRTIRQCETRDPLGHLTARARHVFKQKYQNVTLNVIEQHFKSLKQSAQPLRCHTHCHVYL